VCVCAKNAKGASFTFLDSANGARFYFHFEFCTKNVKSDFTFLRAPVSHANPLRSYVTICVVVWSGVCARPVSTYAHSDWVLRTYNLFYCVFLFAFVCFSLLGQNKAFGFNTHIHTPPDHGKKTSDT